MAPTSPATYRRHELEESYPTSPATMDFRGGNSKTRDRDLAHRGDPHVLDPPRGNNFVELVDRSFGLPSALEGKRNHPMRKAIHPSQAPAKQRSARIAIKVSGSILFINPADVVAVQAEGNHVLLQQDSSCHLLRDSISVVAERLEPYGFIRIHRSVLVNTSFVEEIRSLSTGGYSLRVKGGKQYTVTRTYKKNLKSLADSWIGASAERMMLHGA
jgi:hypothetical protein